MNLIERTVSNLMKLTIMGGVILAVGWYVLPGPLAAGYARLAGVTGFTPVGCTVAPVACFEARERNIKTALDKLIDARFAIDGGLKAVDTEESQLRSQLDSNSGLQTILRSRAAEMLKKDANSLTFQGRVYSRIDAEQQASQLVQEEAAFKAALIKLDQRRANLNETRTAAVLGENSLSSTLATLSAEKAIVLSTGSLNAAKSLLDDSDAAAKHADEITLTVVRSTKELASETSTAQPSKAAGFNFQSWAGGGSDHPNNPPDAN